MSPETLARLVDAYRDGTISDGEARLLAGAIRAGDETSRSIVRELEFEGILAQTLDGIGDEEAFVRSFNERRTAEQEGSAFLRAFERRRPSFRRRRPRAGWLPLAVAASALVAIAVVAATAPARKEPPSIVEAPPPPPVEPAAAEPREESPPPPREEPRAPEPPRPPPPRGEPKPAEPAILPAPPAPPERKPSSAPPRETGTRVAIATVTAAQGEVFRLEGTARAALVAGQGLAPGEGIECGPKGSAVALFPDGTRLEIGPDTLVREIADRKGKRVFLTRGAIAAQVARQPSDQPMVFATPHGEARVLGTALRIEVGAQTRLEVAEGKVRLTRAGGKGVDVPAGGFAQCGPGLDPAARPLHPEEIVLLPQHAKLAGDEWTIVPDRNASSGFALQVAKTPFKVVDHVENRPSFVSFAFHASAEREYRLWVRSTSLATGDKWLREMVTVEPRDCSMSLKSPFFGTAPTNAFVFTGLASWSGYAWSSGAHEEGKPDREPIVVKFHRTGPQTLRIFTAHPSIRIDAVWLSARQLSRPAARIPPPGAEGR